MKHITVYRVTAGPFSRDYYAVHHAEQMARALKMHKPLEGAPVLIEAIRLPDDGLTRLATA